VTRAYRARMSSPEPDRVFDGGGHEETAGYARAVRRGTTITVSGTTANDGEGGALYPGDTAAQTVAALRQALAAVERLGGRIDDVVRTRIFLAPGADWRAASTAHAELLGSVRPANSMLYVHALIGEAFLVEVELDAVVIETTDR
jgi:enamine deaminase RidA (YjgF/YER057c/UK114 family)